MLGIQGLQQAAGNDRNILLALPQRGHFKRFILKLPVQGCAELAVHNQRLQGFATGRNDPDLGTALPVLSPSPELTTLHETGQLLLHDRCQTVDVAQDNITAGRQLQHAAPDPTGIDSPVRCMAEQRRLLGDFQQHPIAGSGCIDIFVSDDGWWG